MLVFSFSRDFSRKNKKLLSGYGLLITLNPGAILIREHPNQLGRGRLRNGLEIAT